MRRKVVGVFLAAGSSKRMGRNKLELKLDADHRLGGYALTEALLSRLDGNVIVVRPGDPLEWLPRLAFGNLLEEGGRFQLLVCPNAEEGMSQSLIYGVRYAKTVWNADAIVVMMADQPFAGKELIGQLLDEYTNDPHWDYVALSENGIPKPPILLSGSMFPAVNSLLGDSGARLLLQNDNFRGKLIAAPDPRCFWDADTPEDWLRILTEYKQLKVIN